ncbi:conserved Plasmodium protein, unknown function [Plasmodium ovale]|uniref:HIT-type domain-containing protein n=2 Tax=Plasmodium ovale TaxID=36330 RepID=A0A1A8WDQ9_PLAOA|nr:conserved Plasmodium protein, unknown function [Plasmodium ovale curtisi]SBS91028.1 conserved Plasmodium protein, unknown function [Plasmodium ovale curtisi]SCQ16157.1 conserved Plasmodium protein, unknown function [Plasmodium ovale]
MEDIEEFDYNYNYDLGSYANNFNESGIGYSEIGYGDLGYANIDRQYIHLENEFSFYGPNMEEGGKEEKESDIHPNTLNSAICIKDEKDITNSNTVIANTILKKRKGSNDSAVYIKKSKKNEVCIVCLQNEKKYKFTCCYDYYCSIACFNRHNKKECLEAQKKWEINKGSFEKCNKNRYSSRNNQMEENTSKSIYENVQADEITNFEENTHLTDEQKIKLKEDLALKLLLKNNYVRSVFKQFSTANDKIGYLSHYINDPTIVQVVDQIMKTIDG